MNLFLQLAAQGSLWTNRACCAEVEVEGGFKVDMRKVCITNIHGFHSWARKLFYLPQLSFPSCYSNKRPFHPLSHSNERVSQKERQLLEPHNPLSYPYLTCRPLWPPKHSRAKDEGHLRDAWHPVVISCLYK